MDGVKKKEKKKEKLKLRAASKGLSRSEQVYHRVRDPIVIVMFIINDK